MILYGIIHRIMVLGLDERDRRRDEKNGRYRRDGRNRRDRRSRRRNNVTSRWDRGRYSIK